MKLKNKIAAVSVLAGMALYALPLAPLVANAEIVEIFTDTFETGYDGWSARGDDVSIAVTDTASHNGGYSLYVSNRTKGWHGAGCAKIRELRAGNTYSLSTWVMFDEGNDTEQLNLKLLYKDASGTEQYKDIASVQAKKGVWTQISNSAYTIPADATNVMIYVETPSNLINFYIDDTSASGEKIDDSDAQDGFSDDFESGAGEWSGRGDAKTSISTDNPHSGTNCLYTTGRVQLWNAPACNKTLVLESGGYYKFGSWVRYTGDEWSDTHKFQLYLQYTQNGSDKYVEVANTKAVKGEWAYIEGKYMLPDDASNIVVYVQTGYVPDAQVTSEDLMDFYIDDVSAERLPEPAIQSDITSLSDAYSDYFKIGCASTATELNMQASQDLINKHYNSLTFGNELKPDSTLDYNATVAYMNSTGDQTNPQISLASAKSLLEFASENNIPVRGHCLVWHSQTPDWFFKENYNPDGDWVSKDVMIERMENYIKNIMETLAKDYPDVDFYAWDVVNEAFTDNGTMRVAGSNNTVNGQSAWMSVFGDDSFIDYAFEFARKYAPEGCKLFYNDYNEYTPAKRDAICEKAAELKAKNLIDGIGMQSHIKMTYPAIDLYSEAIQKYSDLGLEVQVTELDIAQTSGTKDDMLDLAERYREVFEMYKDMKDKGADITAIVLWGITDSTSWIGGYPLLFDADYQAKDAYYAVIDTDAEIQTVKSANAVNADDGAEKAFEVQSAVNVYNKGEFKAVWTSDKKLTVQFTANSDCDVTIVLDDGQTVTKSAVKGESYTADFDIEKAAVETEIGFDIIFGDTAWNDLSYTAGGEIKNFGKIILADMPRYTEAVYGTPDIDGEIDDIWADAKSIKTDVYTMGSDGATANVKTMWDKDYIYVLAEVTDPKLSKSNANVYEQDSVEVFFDENNNKTIAYQSDDIQCRVNYDNEKSVTDGLSADLFTSATSLTPTGYIVEFAVPSTLGGLYTDEVVGFDAQVNDDDGTGSRTGISNWNDITGLGYTNTSQYGVMKLIGGNINPDDGGDDTDAKLLGDANDDGEIDIRDITILNQYIVKTTALNAQQMANADVDLDNVVGIKDLGQLKKYIIKVIDKF